MSSKPIANNIDDLVFENRNKAYGAFVLRQRYGKNMTRGTILGISFFLLLMLSPAIFSWYKGMVSKNNVEIDQMVEVTLTEPPPMDPTKPPPPPPPKVDPPPLRDQIKFVQPVVKKDEEVVEEVPPPDVSQLIDKDPGKEDRKGEEGGKTNVDFTPPPPPPPPPPVEKDEEPMNMASVQQKPEFPDGEAALFRYLSQNIKYPAIARENGIKGKVILSFVVSKSGAIEDVQVIRGIGGGCDQEAVRVVKGMPKWSPGRMNGKAVKVKYTLPVNFTLQD